jgi:hypothetical protein
METSVVVSSVITGMYLSQLCARVMQLAGTHKKDLSIDDYVTKMKSLVDNMASAGQKLDDDLATYILSGLEAEWNPLVSSMTTRNDPVALSDLYTHLLRFKMRIKL